MMYAIDTPDESERQGYHTVEETTILLKES